MMSTHECHLVAMTLMAAAMMVAGSTPAGNLDPTNAPGPTMHTLEEIYQRVIQIPTNGMNGTVSTAVPKTGQTTSYSGKWDDGDTRKGAAWPIPRFTDNGDGTVTDNLTGLVWLGMMNAFGQRDWMQALVDCNTLSSGEHGLNDGSAEGDWRLPNVQELQSLIAYEWFDPCLSNAAGTGQGSEGDPFMSVEIGRYWSGTTSGGYPAEAWYVTFGGGRLERNVKTLALKVWPVRDGP